ncbi:MAG: hypothetical protein SH808_15495, partial [Saprospiraceae bacterium]|nr:hypothetical protein [Saprospiraceae bacterium]
MEFRWMREQTPATANAIWNFGGCRSKLLQRRMLLGISVDAGANSCNGECYVEFRWMREQTPATANA